MKKKLKKASASRKVQKMLSPEELTVVSNIESMLGELTQMGAGAAPMGEAPMEEEAPTVMEEENPMTEEDSMELETEDKEIKMILQKGLENTPSDSATASDDAEERLDDPFTESTEANISEVEKALRVILGAVGNKNIKKSAQPEISPVVQCLNKMAEIQKANNTRVEELSNAFGHVLEGFGIAEQMESVKAKPRRPKTINKSQNDELVQAIRSLMPEKSVEKEEGKSQNNTVRKNLGNRTVLTGMLGK